MRQTGLQAPVTIARSSALHYGCDRRANQTRSRPFLFARNREVKFKAMRCLTRSVDLR